MKTTIIKTTASALAAACSAWLGTAIAFDRTHQSEIRIPAKTIYTLNLDEMREAATLWLNSRGLSTNGSVTAYPLDEHHGDYRRGMTIIVQEP